MSLSDHPRYYGTAAITVAFVAGVLVTLGLKDFYPDLERRYQERRRGNREQSRRATSTTATSSAAARRSSLFWGGPVKLEDRDAAQQQEERSLQLLPPTAGIVDGIEGTIGHTPLVRLRSLSAATGREILAKAEFLNGAGGSPKDRVALAIIDEAERSGLLVPGRGDAIYEGTVGSTGISLAALARARGYAAHICMPDDQATEKSDLLRHLGAEVERVPVAPIADPAHYVNLARRRAAEHTATGGAAQGDNGSRGFFADQFENPANCEAHRRGTGPEIFAQCGGRLDAFVAGAGTGGTVSGVALALKEDLGLGPNGNGNGPNTTGTGTTGTGTGGVRVVLADPQGSGLYHRVRHGVMYAGATFEREGARRRAQVDSVVEGVGCNRVTANFEAGRQLVDDAVRVSDAQACRMARWLSERDGVFAGSSSAVNCVAAVAVAVGGTLPEGTGRVVTVLCDSGARHLSKFWRRVDELAREDGPLPDDLLAYLGLEQPS
ncbi:tryptophan synthase beta subunit-like PLP-dependent enzyme [Xylariaceae sp. FL0804]|nr:tryptophan synthase beta subunit-like PLP-dependent enzyme [Xylariaceae sp. FL0804]